LVRCGHSSKVEHIALEVLTEADLCCPYSAAGAGVNSAATWSPAGAAAMFTAASSSPTTHREECPDGVCPDNHTGLIQKGFIATIIL
jgi:hypothetical protein